MLKFNFEKTSSDPLPYPREDYLIYLWHSLSNKCHFKASGFNLGWSIADQSFISYFRIFLNKRKADSVDELLAK